MIRTHVLAVLALVPAAALAQAAPVQAARGAVDASAKGDARTQRAADAALGAPAAPAPAPAGTAAPTTGQTPPAEEGVGVAPLEAGAAAADQGRGAVPPPDTYTIRPGDTLWDLSGRFLNNPWYWPKIWSYNPDITNPHWIYPGNVLKFYPSAEEGPARVEPAAPGAEPMAAAPGAEAEEEEAAPVRELEDFSRADMKAAPSAEEQEAVAVSGPYKVGYVGPRKSLTYVRHTAFVTPKELEASGVIKAAFEEKLLLSTLDRAYATFKGPAADTVKVGQSYVIYKTERPIVHPVTQEVFGYQSTILGSAKVVAVDEKAVTLVITQAHDVIERGARLAPWTDKVFRPVALKPNGKDLQGVIIGAPFDVLTQLAEMHVVFVDRGSAEGVETGNTFKVVRAGDPYGFPPASPVWDTRLPKEDVGELLVIDAREHASAAVVLRSLVELYIGDRVEMRAAAEAGVQAGAGGN